MANIRPFQAYRPRKGMESLVAALPYDVFSREEAKEEVKGNPFSFLRIDRAETQFDDSVSTYDDRVYAKAAELLQSQIAAGIFVQDDRPCFYLYEQIMAGRAQTGLVACASIDDYLNNVIKKHENTRADKEVDRIRHVDTCNAQTGPIFLCYRNHAVIDEIAARTMESEPVCDFTSGDRIRNRVWIISAASISPTATTGALPRSAWDLREGKKIRIIPARRNSIISCRSSFPRTS